MTAATLTTSGRGDENIPNKQAAIKKFFDKQKEKALGLSRDHVKKQRQVLQYQYRRNRRRNGNKLRN